MRRAPDVPAVISGSEQLTYGELNRRANRLAHHLRSIGVAPDVLVGLCMERTPLMVVAVLAIVKAGGAYVPLDPDYPPERLAFMLADTAAPVMLTNQSLRARLPECAARVLCVDDIFALEGASEDDPIATSTSANLAYVIYTSGSTGMPKGVAVEQRAVTRLVVNTDYVQLGPADTVAQASNISFDAATFEIWGALLNGARLVIVPKVVLLSPQRWLSSSRATASTRCSSRHRSSTSMPRAHRKHFSGLTTCSSEAKGSIRSRYAAYWDPHRRAGF